MQSYVPNDPIPEQNFDQTLFKSQFGSEDYEPQLKSQTEFSALDEFFNAPTPLEDLKIIEEIEERLKVECLPFEKLSYK